ncbi:MAG TPA: hypothetical protein VMU83_00785 [Hanamia sp.]|nr:hypothetical protein [Hanamia sp.]
MKSEKAAVGLVNAVEVGKLKYVTTHYVTEILRSIFMKLARTSIHLLFTLKSSSFPVLFLIKECFNCGAKYFFNLNTQWITDKIEMYKGTPEIGISSPNQMYDVAIPPIGK